MTKVRSEAARAVLDEVSNVERTIPQWRRSLHGAIADAKNDRSVETDLHTHKITPSRAADVFDERDKLTVIHGQVVTARSVINGNITSLLGDLREAEAAWNSAEAAVRQNDFTTAKALFSRADAALVRAMQHCLYLTFLDAAQRGQLGERFDLETHCANWGLPDASVDTIWKWVEGGELSFDGKRLPLALDRSNRTVYRKATRTLTRLGAGTAAIWGAGLTLGVVAALFALLAEAGVKAWPQDAPGWKLAVLLVFVTLGAAAHVGARVLNINYDDPISIHHAGGIWDWLALRWLGVLGMYVPVGIVVAMLWGAGNIPASFDELGTALLAGYSADSLVGAATSRLKTQASQESS